MPDLTIETFYACESARRWQADVKDYVVSFGPSNGQYQYDYSCTCNGFKYRGKCKHVEQVKDQHCNWNQFINEGEPVDGKCPKCGSEVFAYRAGV